MYANNEFKFIAVVNDKIEIPKLMNALGHTTAGLMSKANDSFGMEFLKYKFSGEFVQPSLIALCPYIILKAKNNNQLKTLHLAVNEKAILHNVFTDTMLGASAEEQITQTKNTKVDDLTYFCIILFGKYEEDLKPLTKKFSLFKG